MAGGEGEREVRTLWARLHLIVDYKWYAYSNCERMEPMQQTKRTDAISAENDHFYSVRIEATFGSQFQRTVAIRNLNRMPAAWKELVEARHKKNAITVTQSRA
jgi:hypothetical protein